MTKKKKKVCARCGTVLPGADIFDPLGAAGPKRWCGNCIWAGLYWGLERYTEVSSPSAEEEGGVGEGGTAPLEREEGED